MWLEDRGDPTIKTLALTTMLAGALCTLTAAPRPRPGKGMGKTPLMGQ